MPYQGAWIEQHTIVNTVNGSSLLFSKYFARFAIFVLVKVFLTESITCLSKWCIFYWITFRNNWDLKFQRTSARITSLDIHEKFLLLLRMKPFPMRKPTFPWVWNHDSHMICILQVRPAFSHETHWLTIMCQKHMKLTGSKNNFLASFYQFNQN